MGFLTDEEAGALHVTRMILHVVGKKEVPFVPEPEIAPVQQEPFFRTRILDEAASGVHRFTEHSQVKPLVERMARAEVTFEAGGQELARLFWRDHVKQSTSGAFFLFELGGADPDVTIYAMIKYDYREAVELAQERGRSVLRAIIQAFVKERKAVQKFCMVRVRNGAAEDVVSARDRMADAPDLTDYFEKFLGVARSRSTAELSSRLNEALRSALAELKDHLPDGDVGLALGKVKAALQPRDSVTNDDVVDAVLHAAGRPADEKVRATLERATRRRLHAQDLDDVEFRPDQRIFKLGPRRVVRTAEEVRLEYPDEELGRSVIRQVAPGGGYSFTIRTDKPLVQDDTLPIRADRAG